MGGEYLQTFQNGISMQGVYPNSGTIMKFHHAIRKFLPKPIRDRGYSAIVSSLDRFGFIHRVMAGPISFRGLDINPAEAIKRSAGLPCVIDVVPEHLRNVGPMTGVSYFPCQ